MKEKNLLRHLDKGGDSIILSYVLLIVLTVGMASAVYSYLKFYVPKEQDRCPDGVSLIIRDINCSGNTFNITLQNKGLFNVDGSFIKVGRVGSEYKEIINCPNQTDINNCRIFFNLGPPLYNLRALRPDDYWTDSFNYTQGIGEREIEIQPIVIVRNSSRILCSNAIITKNIRCG